MASSLYKPVAAVAKEPVLMADKVEPECIYFRHSSSVFVAWSIQGQGMFARQPTLSRGFGERISAPSSLYLAEAKHRRHIKRRRRHEGVCHSFCNE